MNEFCLSVFHSAKDGVYIESSPLNSAGYLFEMLARYFFPERLRHVPRQRDGAGPLIRVRRRIVLQFVLILFSSQST